jgi:hypothetical protein
MDKTSSMETLLKFNRPVFNIIMPFILPGESKTNETSRRIFQEKSQQISVLKKQHLPCKTHLL